MEDQGEGDKAGGRGAKRGVEMRIHAAGTTEMGTARGWEGRKETAKTRQEEEK